MPPRAPTAPILLRLGPSLAGLLAYAVFAGLWSRSPHTYATLLWLADAMPQNARPYGDLWAIIQAASCWRGGVNVYAPSACMHGGVYNYSPFLLHVLGLPSNAVPCSLLGAGLGIAFLAALALLPPAQSRAELICRIAATCSPTVVFALERANLDVAIFLLVLAAVLLLLTQRWPAVLGYALLLFAAACKFYPAVLLALLLRERPRHVLAAALCLAGAGILYLLRFGAGTLTALETLPVGLPFNGIFGAGDLPFGLVLLHVMPALTLSPNPAQYLTGIHRPGAIPWIELLTRLAVLAGLFAGYLNSPRYRDFEARISPVRLLFLLAGALVMVFCFCLTQNIPYRAIFFLMLLPGLWELASRGDGKAGNSARALLAAVLLLLWEDGLRQRSWDAANSILTQAQAFYPEFVLWLAWEALWWWVIIQFTGLIFSFLRQSLARLIASMQSPGFTAHG